MDGTRAMMRLVLSNYYTTIVVNLNDVTRGEI